MKKIYKQILLALSVLLMVGCQNTNTKMKKVAIIQYMEHTSLDTIKAAFDQQMEHLGYKDGENVEYIFKNAQGDNNIAASIVFIIIWQGLN